MTPEGGELPAPRTIGLSASTPPSRAGSAGPSPCASKPDALPCPALTDPIGEEERDLVDAEHVEDHAGRLAKDIAAALRGARLEREPIQDLNPAELLLDRALGDVEALLRLREELDLLVQRRVLPPQLVDDGSCRQGAVPRQPPRSYRAQSTTL
jgi:hypothetical protein